MSEATASPPPPAAAQAAAAAATATAARGLSPNQRAWARFKRNRLGYTSLWLFMALLIVATLAELVSNDKPFIARVEGQLLLPIVSNPPEISLGGDFATPIDWKDPFTVALLAKPDNWFIGAPNPHSANSIDYFSKLPPPAAPSAKNWLGTDDKGRDMFARLLYGFRVSIWFALALTVTGTVIGIGMGALMGYFGGKLDLTLQRIIEV